MTVFSGYEVDEDLRPVAQLFDFDLEAKLSSVVALEAHIPADAPSANRLGAERVGNAVVIGEQLLATIGFLITEAEEVILTTNDGRRVEAYPLGVDQPTGFGVLQALEPLDLPALTIGNSSKVKGEAAIIAAGGGGQAHALCGRILAREPFAGYWEYCLDEALYIEPAHPHWPGAALIGPAGDLIGVGSLRMEQRDLKGGISPLNMFVPAEMLPPLLDDLTHGRPAHPPRAWLGVSSEEVSSHVVIIGVTPGGPAARAELRRGDIVHRLAGQRVNDLASFYKGLWALGPPGVVAPLTIQREHDVFDVEIRTGDRVARQRKRRLN